MRFFSRIASHDRSRVASGARPTAEQLLAKVDDVLGREQIVIAVGTHPVPPPGVAADGEVVITGDDVVRLKQVPRAMTVVGGSVIGIEYASMFSALGVPVTLIEKSQRPLASRRITHNLTSLASAAMRPLSRR